MDGLSHAEQWLTSNSDLFIQYGVNIIAMIILFIGNIIVKAVANSVSRKVLQEEENGLSRYGVRPWFSFVTCCFCV